ncbi:MAG: hypothetical protein HY698_14050, partial [Deltaproteobacteria bacterium]|nr:hypothetical protein [Deltaproteobacteria bacterium]
MRRWEQGSGHGRKDRMKCECLPSLAGRPGTGTILVFLGGAVIASCSSSGTGSTPDAGMPGRDAVACSHSGNGIEYQVGPGKGLARLGDVPWAALKAGDTVRVFFRPEPYRETVLLSGVG